MVVRHTKKVCRVQNGDLWSKVMVSFAKLFLVHNFVVYVNVNVGVYNPCEFSRLYKINT